MSDVKLNSKVPEGKLQEKWDNHKFKSKLINPANKRKFNVIIVINVLLRVFLLLENMVELYQIDLLVGLKFQEHSMLEDKQDNNFFLVLIQQ